MGFINLVSSDGEIHTVYIEFAKCSATIKSMLSDCGDEEKNREEEIDDYGDVPLPNVDSATLKLVIEWLKYHFMYEQDLIDPTTGEQYLPLESESDELKNWEENFLRIDNDSLFKLLAASDYLEVPSLKTEVSEAIARKIRGMPLEVIQMDFNRPPSSSQSSLQITFNK
ncbi:S-phase kinase-associated protein 1-like [Harmonia axyridis]|uniref:S-phase kinase-associated protein 1-like n=1 Tax=Harmonia axyridis TaxID=115357 RepID=UPI001E276F6E|nr:S-phase kinase-associated protein 1-like [Harmonia axyridis]